MKIYKKIIYGLLAITLLSSAQCKKWNLDKDGLPKATQTGANTLGFLLNGEPWYPKGMVGLSSNLSISVELGFEEGGFSIYAYNYNSKEEKRETFGLGIKDSLNKMVIPISLAINQQSLVGIRFSEGGCRYSSMEENIYSKGILTISKLDKTSGIIAGTFEAVLYKEGCDTLKITNGRFDMKF